MINIRFITNIIGKLLLIECVCFLLCVLISLLYGESDTLAFLYSAIITGITGMCMAYIVKAPDQILAKKDGYFTVTCIWLFSPFSAVCLLLSATPFPLSPMPFLKPCPVLQQPVPLYLTT